MYFSDRELGNQNRISEEITISVWNGIVTIFKKMEAENCFSGNFPESCGDGLGICGFDNEAFEDRLKSEIPNIDIPIRRKEEKVLSGWGDEDDKNITVNVYAVLDFVEFCYKNIQKAIKGEFHEYYKHYELSFEEGEKVQEKFRLDINTIFERNGIVFFLNEKGEINRTIPKSMQSLIDDRPNTKDERLNDLVNLAYNKFILPKYSDRIHALEKIWDAFERIKTYYSDNKKTSIKKIINISAKNNEVLEKQIEEDTNSLTKIGNNFQIRHFEQCKTMITDNNHIDYLFYRMLNLMHLFLDNLKIN